MSAAALHSGGDERLPRHTGSWAASLAVHGLLAGVTVWFAVSVKAPEIEIPFRWDVALVSASVPATAPASAAKASIVQPVRTPPVAPAVAPLLPVPAVQADAPADTTPPLASVMPIQAQQVMRNSEEAFAPAPPVVASAPVPVSTASTANTGELADLLWRRMETLKRYPYLARRNGWEGKVLLRVVLGDDGRLLHAEVQESSGHEALDQDALQVLRAATPLKVDPNSSWHQATLTIPVAYRLQR